MGPTGARYSEIRAIPTVANKRLRESGNVPDALHRDGGICCAGNRRVARRAAAAET
jgi:hypothetical protein